MTGLAYRTAAALGESLGAHTPGRAVQVVHAPPTLDGAYPGLAIEFLGRPRIDTSGDREIAAADGHGLVVGDGSAVVEVAAMRADARIWAGARSPSKRERLQDAVLASFYADEFAPGRLLITLRDVQVGDYMLPVPLTVACEVREAEWSDEQVMTERYQAYLYISLDVPILVLRADSWRVTSMVAELAADPNLTSATPVDEVLVDENGAITTAP